MWVGEWKAGRIYRGVEENNEKQAEGMKCKIKGRAEG